MAVPKNRIQPTLPECVPPGQCVVGDTLCEVRVLSDAEWQAIPPDRRPATAEYFPGLGWVVATPGLIK
jgi:hypothetical protein